MTYRKDFDPGEVLSFRSDYSLSLEERTDKRDGEVYVFGNDQTVLAVNVALATGRPLLIYGAAGSGKSSLAASIARALQRRYYEGVVTSRSSAQDLLWTFDVVQRLGDATTNRSTPAIPGSPFEFGLHRYIEPGVLWWAFDPQSAARQGLKTGPASLLDPSAPAADSAAVVLIDEIDKADPDVPNNLLVPIGSLTFTVKETGTQVAAGERIPLIVFTSNEERDLPAAFVRRCIVLRLPLPTEQQLIRIAEVHFGPDPSHAQIYRVLAMKTVELRDAYALLNQRPPSTAEFLDSVRACLRLKIVPKAEYWDDLVDAVLAKPDTGEMQR